MALLKIFRDGTFEAVAATDRTTYMSMIKALKATNTVLNKDIKTSAQITAKKSELSAIRDTIAKIKLKPHGTSLPVYARSVKARDKAKAQITALTAKMSGGKYVSITSLRKRVATNLRKIATYTEKAAAQKARIVAKPATPKAKNPLPKLDGPKPSRAAPATKRTPRAQKDHGAAFDREAKRLATQSKRETRGTLTEHARTSLVRISRPGTAKTPASTKTPKSIVKPTTKVSDSATASVLKVIKQIKLDLETAKPGPKADRLRLELAKNRKHLRELRAGKTTKNQAHINPKTSAKEAGMGTARRVKSVAAPAPKTRTLGTPAAERAKYERLLEKTKADVKELRKRIVAAKGNGPLHGKLSIRLQRLNAKIIRLEGKIKQK